MIRSHQDLSPTCSAQYQQAPFNSHASTHTIVTPRSTLHQIACKSYEATRPAIDASLHLGLLVRRASFAQDHVLPQFLTLQ